VSEGAIAVYGFKKIVEIFGIGDTKTTQNKEIENLEIYPGQLKIQK
jgi:hypothetical protein